MSQKVKIRTVYNDDYVDPGLQCVTPDGEPEPSLTVQSELAATDINNIVEKHTKTGLLPVMTQSPVFGDVSSAPTYQESLNVVIEAQKLFMGLDAKIRKEFDNDPAQFLAFVDDPKNGDRLIEMGLREAPEPAPASPEPKQE